MHWLQVCMPDQGAPDLELQPAQAPPSYQLIAADVAAQWSVVGSAFVTAKSFFVVPEGLAFIVKAYDRTLHSRSTLMLSQHVRDAAGGRLSGRISCLARMFMQLSCWPGPSLSAHVNWERHHMLIGSLHTNVKGTHFV